MGKCEKKKVKYIVLGIFFIGFLLSGCGYTEEEKALMQQYEEQGRQNASMYIYEKYGFQPEIQTIKCEKVDPGPILEFFPAPTGMVYVTMSYQGKEFDVKIAGDEETTEGRDDYQKGQIEEAFKDYMEKETGYPVREVFLCYGSNVTVDRYPEGNGMVQTYFDGTNLMEVVTEDRFRGIVSYINKDLSETILENIRKDIMDGRILLVSYRSEEDYTKCDRHTYNIAGHPIEDGIMTNSLYIQEYLYFDETDKEYVQYEIQEYAGICCIAENVGENVHLEETTMDEASNFNGHGFLEAKQLTPAYQIVTDSEKVQCYFPLESIPSDEREGISIAIQYKDEGEKCYRKRISELTEDGKYLTTSLYLEDYEDVKIAIFASE